jgi:hypothetical protein
MPEDYTPRELAEMDEDEARNTLTVAQFERWEGLQDLFDEQADTEEEWEQQEETVQEVTVSADMEQLGTHVEVYGNDLLVRADPDSSEFRSAIDALDDEFGDIEVADEDADGADAFGDVDRERLDDLADHLLEMLDSVLVKWDGARWAGLPSEQRDTILAESRAKWGVDGLLLAWGDIVTAIREDHEGTVSQLESFRGAEGRGDN